MNVCRCCPHTKFTTAYYTAMMERTAEVVTWHKLQVLSQSAIVAWSIQSWQPGETPPFLKRDGEKALCLPREKEKDRKTFHWMTNSKKFMIFHSERCLNILLLDVGICLLYFSLWNMVGNIGLQVYLNFFELVEIFL